MGMAQFDFGEGELALIYTHGVTKVIVVVEGMILVDFIRSYGTTYCKTLRKGDAMVLPPSLLHF